MNFLYCNTFYVAGLIFEMGLTWRSFGRSCHSTLQFYVYYLFN